MSIVYDFSSGLPDGWTTIPGMTPWASATGEGPNGTTALRAGAITHNESTGVQFTTPTIGTNEKLRVQFKVSSESRYDYFTVSVDSVIVIKTSGDLDWARVNLDVATGQVVQFVYHKDESESAGSDTVWLGQVAIEAVVPVSGSTTILTNDNLVASNESTPPAYLWNQTDVFARLRTHNHTTCLDYGNLYCNYGHPFLRSGDTYDTTTTQYERPESDEFDDTADVDLVLANTVCTSRGSEFRYRAFNNNTAGLELWFENVNGNDVYTFLTNQLDYFTPGLTHTTLIGFVDKDVDYATLSYSDLLAGFHVDGNDVYFVVDGTRTVAESSIAFDFYVFFELSGYPRSYSENLTSNLIKLVLLSNKITRSNEIDMTAKNIKLILKQTNTVTSDQPFLDQISFVAISGEVVAERWQNFVRTAEVNR